METVPTVTGIEDDDLVDIDTPDWRSRNTELRTKYIAAQAVRDQAVNDNDPDATETATRALDELGRQFYELNQGLALASARRFSTGAGSISDYQAAAALGLWEAFTRWDPARGVAFSTFSRQYVNGRIQRAVRQVEYSQLSQSEFSLRKHIRVAANSISSAEQRPATVEEIAEAVGEKPERVLRTLSAPNASLETPLGDGSSTLGDLIADETPDLGGIDSMDDLSALLDNLPDLEAWILAGRSGAYGGETPSLLDIAGHLGIGREIARRAETRGRLTLAREKLEREADTRLTVEELAEKTGRPVKELRKYLLEDNLAELRRQWARASDQLARAGDRQEAHNSRNRLDHIGRASITLIARDAHSAAERRTHVDGEDLTADEAASMLFDAFLQWDPDTTTWKAQAQEHLERVTLRKRRHTPADELDQGNTWDWLKARHVNNA